MSGTLYQNPNFKKAPRTPLPGILSVFGMDLGETMAADLVVSVMKTDDDTPGFGAVVAVLALLAAALFARRRQ